MVCFCWHVTSVFWKLNSSLYPTVGLGDFCYKAIWWDDWGYHRADCLCLFNWFWCHGTACLTAHVTGNGVSWMILSRQSLMNLKIFAVTCPLVFATKIQRVFAKTCHLLQLIHFFSGIKLLWKKLAHPIVNFHGPCGARALIAQKGCFSCAGWQYVQWYKEKYIDFFVRIHKYLHKYLQYIHGKPVTPSLSLPLSRMLLPISCSM